MASNDRRLAEQHVSKNLFPDGRRGNNTEPTLNAGVNLLLWALLSHRLVRRHQQHYTAAGDCTYHLPSQLGQQQIDSDHEIESVLLPPAPSNVNSLAIVV